MQQTTKGWHTANWGTLGWLETGLKLAAALAGFVAFVQSSSSTTWTVANHPHLVAVIILALMTLIWIGTLWLRFQQREIISMIYSILNALGHVALLVALLRMPEQRVLPVIFGVLWVLGELVKRRFLTVSGYTESGRSTSAMLQVSTVFTIAYGLFTVLMLI